MNYAAFLDFLANFTANWDNYSPKEQCIHVSELYTHLLAVTSSTPTLYLRRNSKELIFTLLNRAQPFLDHFYFLVVNGKISTTDYSYVCGYLLLAREIKTNFEKYMDGHVLFGILDKMSKLSTISLEERLLDIATIYSTFDLHHEHYKRTTTGREFLQVLMFKAYDIYEEMTQLNVSSTHAAVLAIERYISHHDEEFHQRYGELVDAITG